MSEVVAEDIPCANCGVLVCRALDAYLLLKSYKRISDAMEVHADENPIAGYHRINRHEIKITADCGGVFVLREV